MLVGGHHRAELVLGDPDERPLHAVDGARAQHDEARRIASRQRTQAEELPQVVVEQVRRVRRVAVPWLDGRVHDGVDRRARRSHARTAAASVSSSSACVGASTSCRDGEPLDDVAADEAAAAGDQDSHHPALDGSAVAPPAKPSGEPLAHRGSTAVAAASRELPRAAPAAAAGKRELPY